MSHCVDVLCTNYPARLAVSTVNLVTENLLQVQPPLPEMCEPRTAFEATLDIFQHAGKVTRRHRYEDAIAPPPQG